jgi:hypothetical protein
MGKEMANIFEPVIKYMDRQDGLESKNLRGLLKATGIIIPEKRSTVSSYFSFETHSATKGAGNGGGCKTIGASVHEQTTKLAEGDIQRLQELKKYIEQDDFLNSIKINNMTLSQYLESEIISFVQLVATNALEQNESQIAEKVKEMMGQWIHLSTDESLYTGMSISESDPSHPVVFGRINVKKAGLQTTPVRIASLRGDQGKWSVQADIAQEEQKIKGPWAFQQAFAMSRETKADSVKVVGLTASGEDEDGTESIFDFKIMERLASRSYKLVEKGGELVLIP